MRGRGEGEAYCSADEAERRRVEDHMGDITHERVMEMLIADSCVRGRVSADLPNETDLSLVIVDEDIHDPAPMLA